MSKTPFSFVAHGLLLVWLGGIVPALCVGCGGEASVLEVAPNQVAANTETTVIVYGDGFEWGYSPLLNSVSGDFRVFAGQTELTDVEWLDATRLEATVPASLAAGLYDVRVDMEHLQETAGLENALLVTPMD